MKQINLEDLGGLELHPDYANCSIKFIKKGYPVEVVVEGKKVRKLVESDFAIITTLAGDGKNLDPLVKNSQNHIRAVDEHLAIMLAPLYLKWKQEQKPVGDYTLLEFWPEPTTIERLACTELGLETVEDIAELSSYKANKHSLTELTAKAKAYVKRDEAVSELSKAEVEIAALKDQLAKANSAAEKAKAAK